MGRHRHSYSHLLLSLVLLCALCHSSAAQLKINTTQAQILTDLFKILESDFAVPNASLRNNSNDGNQCNWTRITCSSGGGSGEVVKELSFSNLGISSTNSSAVDGLFDVICSLNTLQHLDLSGNSLNSLGSFTNCTGLTNFKYLNFSNNKLSGQIPNLSNFEHLEVLDLSFNGLNGTVGTKLDLLTRLQSLNLSTNMLTGQVPALVSGQQNGTLRELVLSMNNFTGPFPNDTFKHGNLTWLDLSENKLIGSVPDDFNKVPKLETLLLNANNLSGTIPKSITNLTNLSRFGAYQNKFYGSIPSGLTKYIKVLDLSYNNLIGELHSDLLSVSTVESVDFTGNGLMGSIPFNLSRNLSRLRLSGNRLNGSLPNSFGGLSRLSYLELEGNNFSGDIPKSLGSCKNLTLLNLANNTFQNELPPELGNLSNLVVLKLQENNISGEIPYQISHLAKLSTLNLSQNALSGGIPSQIFDLLKLSNLNLQGNNLSGSIPTTISNMSSLIELQLGKNKFNGTIPEMPSSLNTALNLSHNCFSGSILSSSFQNLIQLEILDLSYNNFSGPVPDSLTNLQSLTLLDLSNNNLSGTLPSFRSWVNVLFSNNSLLSNSSQEANPNSSSNTHSKQTIPKSVVILLSIVGAFFGLLLLVGLILFSFSKRFYRVEDSGLQLDDFTLPHIINGRFITNNSIHTSNIDFSKSMEAVANPSNVFMKTRFCTYYRVEMPNGSAYSVKKLTFSEKTIQIGNQEKFGRELEVLGRLTSSNVMVPLAYVLTEDNAYLFYEHIANGTVFDALHGSGGGGGVKEVLDWKCRYGVALGVAQGLTFLHGCTQPVLLLDLSTKSLHLKSLNEPQIGDIELYKVIDPSKSTGSFSTIAGTVGYIPPEYAYTMRLTMAGNVYSFGVVLLELLTGKPPVNEGIELAKWALSNSARAEDRDAILDARISRASIPVHSQMQSVLKIALACVAFSPDSRPKMRNVLRMLFNAK